MRRIDLSLGFSLLELIVVIGILGVLMTALISLINPTFQLQKARDGQRKSEIKLLQSAIEQYRADNDAYPQFVLSDGVTYTYGHAPVEGSSSEDFAINRNGVTYLQTIPTGPNTGGNACLGYHYSGNANKYTIYTYLENPNDADALAVKPAPNSGGGSAGTTFTFSSGSCNTTTVYNYWVNNP